MSRGLFYGFVYAEKIERRGHGLRERGRNEEVLLKQNSQILTGPIFSRNEYNTVEAGRKIDKNRGAIEVLKQLLRAIFYSKGKKHLCCAGTVLPGYKVFERAM